MERRSAHRVTRGPKRLATSHSTDPSTCTVSRGCGGGGGSPVVAAAAAGVAGGQMARRDRGFECARQSAPNSGLPAASTCPRGEACGVRPTLGHASASCLRGFIKHAWADGRPSSIPCCWTLPPAIRCRRRLQSPSACVSLVKLPGTLADPGPAIAGGARVQRVLRFSRELRVCCGRLRRRHRAAGPAGRAARRGRQKGAISRSHENETAKGKTRGGVSAKKRGLGLGAPPPRRRRASARLMTTAAGGRRATLGTGGGAGIFVLYAQNDSLAGMR